MTSLLKSKGLYVYCEQLKHETEEEQRANEEAKHLMYASMEVAQIIATGTCDTAAELWLKIQENNQGAELSLQTSALAEFLGFKYQKNETIINYCGRSELALGRLTSTGYTVDEATKLYVFRNTLPRELKTSVNTWTMARPEGLIIDLISQLKLQHHIDNMSLEESVALNAQDKRRFQPN